MKHSNARCAFYSIDCFNSDNEFISSVNVSEFLNQLSFSPPPLYPFPPYICICVELRFIVEKSLENINK